MVGNISDSDAEMQTMASRPTMFWLNTPIRASTTPEVAITSSNRVGRNLPSSQNITNREMRNRIRLACRK